MHVLSTTAACRAIGALVLGAALLTGCGDEPDPGADRAEQVRVAAVGAGLDAEIADFLARASRGLTATYQATYPGPDPDSQIVVANRPPDRRIDIVVGGVIAESRIILDGEAFRCVRDVEAGRITDCERTDAVVDPPGVFDQAAVDRLTTSLAARADDFTFRIDSAPIAGVEATCLITEIRTGRERPELGADASICISGQGALLRVDQSGETLEATDFTLEIPDNTFVRPDRAD